MKLSFSPFCFWQGIFVRLLPCLCRNPMTEPGMSSLLIKKIFDGRKARQNHFRGNALSSRAAPALEGQVPAHEGHGHKYSLYLSVLECARTGTGQMGLFRQSGFCGIHQGGAEGRPVGHRASRALCVRGMGIRRISRLAAERGGCESPFPGSPLPGTGHGLS